MLVRRPSLLLLLPAALVLALGACGSSGSDSGGSSGSSGTAGGGKAPVSLSGDVTNKGTKAVAAGATELDIEADDFSFKPTFVKAAPGQKLTVKIENEGSATHTFTSDALGVDEEVAPGESKTVEITVPTDGAAGYFCRFHQGQGMQGAVFTVDGQTVAS